MKRLSFLTSGGLYIELRERSLKILHGQESLALPLERDHTGRLTKDCKAKISAGLRTLLKMKNWQRRTQAFCAIEARGVSLRRLSLPASAQTDLQRVLRLQIESEFPLPPEALAWGCTRINTDREKPPLTPALSPSDREPGTSGIIATNGSQDFTVVALKKELLEEYIQMLGGAGVTPVFTVAALARGRACPPITGSYAVLDIGRRQSELISFQDGGAESLRVLPWGGDDITRAIEETLGISQDEAEKLKLQSDEGPAPNGEANRKIQDAIGKSLEALASVLNSNWRGQKLYLTGRGSRYRDMPRRLTQLLLNHANCERIESASGEGMTAAILGLKKAAESETAPLLVLSLKESKAREAQSSSGLNPARWLAVLKAESQEILTQPVLKKWARLALLLCICSVGFPYAQAFLLKPLLTKKIAAIRAEKGRLATIDRELTFLQYLKKSQPPYLDALTVLANSAPPGTHLETVSMNRRGELSMKGNMGNAQQVVDFRSKLIKSGYFSTVTLEEQTPSPDRQRMAVRIVTQVKPAGARPPVKVEPLPPGFSPGIPWAPSPGMGMGMGGPVVSFPGPGGMPPPMNVMRGGPEGAMMRGPDGAPIFPGGARPAGPMGIVRMGTNAEPATNSATTTDESKKAPQ